MKIQIIKLKSVDSTKNVALRRIKKGKIKPTQIKKQKRKNSNKKTEQKNRKNKTEKRNNT